MTATTPDSPSRSRCSEKDCTDGETVCCRVDVLRWNHVAVWSWDTCMTQCAICKNALNNCCIDCQVCGCDNATYSSSCKDAAGGAASLERETIAQAKQRADRCAMASSRSNGARRSLCDSNPGHDGHVYSDCRAGDGRIDCRRRDDAGMVHGQRSLDSTRLDLTQSAADTSGHEADTDSKSSLTSSELSDKQKLTGALLEQLRQRTGECVVAWGSCGHVFHLHCILRWVEQKSICPLCGQVWDLVKLTFNTT